MTEKIIIKATDVKNPLASVDTTKPGKQVITDSKGKVLKVVTVTGETLTEQAHKKQCDINYILRDYVKTGLLKHASKYEGKYDDVTGVDFQNAMFMVASVHKMFNELPSSIRERFDGKPEAFLDFVQNPANKHELAQMGMLKGNDGLTAAGAVSGAPQADPPPTPAPAE